MGSSKHAVATIWAILALALSCAVACSPSVQPVSRIETKADMKGASLVALTKLPRSPERGTLDAYCEGYRAKKLTSTGRQVANFGWIVTSEQRLGRYNVVTFASGFDTGTS